MSSRSSRIIDRQLLLALARAALDGSTASVDQRARKKDSRLLRALALSRPLMATPATTPPILSDQKGEQLDEAWLEEGEDEDSPFASDAPDLASSVDTQTPTYATASDRTRQRFRRADTADTAHTMGFNTLHRSRASRSFRGTARPVLSAV
ncbi:unnamed protein product [Effrenium voratum]|nr:unnamed protein product [Effrenium voratum]